LVGPNGLLQRAPTGVPPIVPGPSCRVAVSVQDRREVRFTLLSNMRWAYPRAYLPSFRAPPPRRVAGRGWYLIAEQPAPAPHLAHPAGCAALRIVRRREVYTALEQSSETLTELPRSRELSEVIL